MLYIPSVLFNDPDNIDEIYGLFEEKDLFMNGEKPISVEQIIKKLADLGEDRVLEFYKKNL